jgi:transposase
MSVGKRSRLSRGDARRNARIQRLRAVVRPELAVLAVDLADAKQAVVICDHDGRVLARRTFRCRAWELDRAVSWGQQHARAGGFAGVVVACEPTGHRWKVLARLAGQAGAELVCVPPMLVARGREEEDLTRDRSDDKDALVIARLAAQLRCYRPERPTPTWARLRHLGARRAHLLVAAGAARQQLRDLLECACPALLDAAREPLDSASWRAAVTVALDHWQGQPGGVSLDGAAFTAQVTGQLPRWGTTRPYRPIIAAVHAATACPDGVAEQRRGALERARGLLDDWHQALAALGQVEQRMVAVLGELGLAGLVATIDGLSPLGAAAILAETGDPARFDCARALVKHAGLCPRDNASGTSAGPTRISRRGRPGLRLACWRAVWGALPHNQVLRARHQHLTTRTTNRLTPTQARVAVAAALLRQLWVVATRRVPWDASIAAGTDGDHGKEVTPAA